MTLKILIKNSYGRELYYPDCETSTKLLSLTSKATFSAYDLKTLQSIGYELIIAHKTELKF